MRQGAAPSAAITRSRRVGLGGEETLSANNESVVITAFPSTRGRAAGRSEGAGGGRDVGERKVCARKPSMREQMKVYGEGGARRRDLHSAI